LAGFAVIGNVPTSALELNRRSRHHAFGLGAALGALSYIRRVHLFDILEAMPALLALVFIQGQFKLLSFHSICAIYEKILSRGWVGRTLAIAVDREWSRAGAPPLSL
jgi:hypothetical protein